MIAAALVRGIELPGYTVSLATVIAAIVMAYWIALERTIGVLTAIVHLPILWLADQVTDRGAVQAWTFFGAFFLGGWILQLWGHAAFEGRKPALLDNVAQALIAPFFLMAEVVFALGWKKALHDAIEARYKNFV